MIPLPPCDHDECPKTGCTKTKQNKMKPQLNAHHTVLPRWIRLTPEGQERVHQEWLRAFDSEARPEWKWFCGIVDFQEGCNRTSLKPNWRTRTIGALTWLAERIATGTWKNT